jgi:hypothetical protein
MQWYAGDKARGAIDSLVKKFTGESFSPANRDTLPTLKERQARYQTALKTYQSASSKMDRAQRQFFLEQMLPLLTTARHTDAAVMLVQAMSESDNAKSFAMCQEAMKPLEQLELDIARTERPPFEGWYRPTYIRHQHTGLNIHAPYLSLRAFLSSGGTQRLSLPENALRPDVEVFLPLLLKND